MHTVRDVAADLLLGTACVGCGRPGRMLCQECRRQLPTTASVAWPTPTPRGLVAPWAAGDYGGLLRAMVVGHKDRHQLGWRRELGRLLALSVTAATGAPADGVPVLLVPVPSRRGATRSRGHDPTRRLVAAAARRLRADGVVALACPLLDSWGVVADQAGLGAAGRAGNVTGSMACRGPLLRRVARRHARAHVVVCDDVVTTGSTLREAQRALEAVGVRPVGAAVVAATQRRVPSTRA